ncbi:MAG: putative DNA-binding domain-containing protein [Rhodocyclales bacterium]|nr:putative DNA-binding domain-containing protein [Rhodocyclales bacterium]
MQTAFADALLGREPACPAGLVTWNGSDPAQRFAVYRNNVVVSLIDALADTYPVVQQLVGEEFFRAMARLFALARPPDSPVMAHYGAGFAEFVAGFPPAAALPYLADVARLEYLYVQVYHAADEAPAECVLHSRYAVASLWAAHQADDIDAALARVDPYVGESALVQRAGLAVLVMCIGERS